MWVKPCISDPEPGVVEETIGIKEQPGNENDLEPSTTIAGRQKETTQPSRSRLNHLMMLHVYKDRPDALTLVDVANDFVGKKENRKHMFGKFSANDIPNMQVLYFVKVNTNGKLETKQEVLYTTVVI